MNISKKALYESNSQLYSWLADKKCFCPSFYFVLKSDISKVPRKKLHEEIIHLKQYTDHPIQSESSISHNCQEQVISDNADIW